MLENLDKIMHLRFDFDACPMHSPSGFVHLTHQNLSARALFCLNSLAKVNTQLLIYNYCYKFETKLLLITNRKLGKLGESKFIHMTVKGIVMFTPTLRCECAQPASDRLMRKWCIAYQSCTFFHYVIAYQRRAIYRK